MKFYRCFFCFFFLALCVPSFAQQAYMPNPTASHGNAFEDINALLPSPNVYRGASGAPGVQYWQQRADYYIECTLEEKAKKLYGEATITYYNNSPDALSYLWLELNENQHHPTEHFDIDRPSTMHYVTSIDNHTLAAYEDAQVRFQGLGMNIESVSDEKKSPLPFIINKTLMRIDLKTPLQPNQKIKFMVKWNYRLPERLKLRNSRGGYENFPDSNAIFTITQWYPRMCVYNDYQGWDLLQFTGRAEFPLNFGNFEVRIKVPSDHIVAATGVCQNYKNVLSDAQYKRWEKAQNSDTPVMIVSLAEAQASSKNTSASGYKVWHYKAENVRGFAWTSSRRFIWDAMNTPVEGRKVMAMSLYPKEAYPLYSKFSTKTVAHTLRSYSQHSIPYPYPVAISVEAANGMEYPMICFNYGRCKEDGSYDEKTRNGMISVIIHEVGHNFFPMIINNNERRWAWLDEGFNSFVQFLTEQAFDNNFPSRRGPAYAITRYMRSDRKVLEPIMTQADNILQLGNNVYGKTATALNILRETVMGRELFDHAFKEYARRWAFKSPTPADFFRTMQDASGMDLSWFFRAWFFETTPVDISLDSIIVYQTSSRKEDSLRTASALKYKPRNHITRTRNLALGKQSLIEQDSSLRDQYSQIDRETVPLPVKEQLPTTPLDSLGRYAYELVFSNQGGSVMPIIIGWTYEDGSYEKQMLPAEIWRHNEKNIRRVFVKRKAVKNIQLDPDQETADINTHNNKMNKAKIYYQTLLKKDK